MLLCCVTSFFGRKGKKDGVVALLWLGIVSSGREEGHHENHGGLRLRGKKET